MQVVSKQANIQAELINDVDKISEQSLITKTLGGTLERLSLICEFKIWQSSVKHV